MMTRSSAGPAKLFLMSACIAAAVLLSVASVAGAQANLLPPPHDSSAPLLPPTPVTSLESAEFSAEHLQVFRGAARAEIERGPLAWEGLPPLSWDGPGFSLLRVEEPAGEMPEAWALETDPPRGQIRADYTPITPGERFRWVMKSTFGFRSVAMGLISSGVSTARNNPHEWGPGWEGFGKRFGSGQATKLISATVEGTVGMLWGEDPRYLRSGRKGFWPRFGYAVKMAFLSYRKDGSVGFSYARFTGVATSRFVSSTWRPPSSDDWQDSAARIGTSYLSRIASNLWSEFWPWRRHK